MSRLKAKLREIKTLIGNTENVKLSVARRVRDIHRDKLYAEDGFKSFAAFLPVLLEDTAHVGWNADRTIKAYVKFVAIYDEQLRFDERNMVGAVSHLMELLKLAATGKDFALQPDTDKPGVLVDEEFGELAEAIYKVVLPDGEDNDPADGYQVINRLLGTQYLSDRPWTLEDTKALIAKIQNKPEQVKAVVTRTWYAEKNDDDSFTINGFAVEVDGTVVYAPETQPSRASAELFAKLVGKDNVNLDGWGSEEEDEE